jgi:hypothetical protein
MPATLPASGTYVWIWAAWLGLIAVVLAVIVGWAIRAGQFRNQDHARRLPLESDAPVDDAGDAPAGTGHQERGRHHVSP